VVKSHVVKIEGDLRLESFLRRWFEVALPDLWKKYVDSNMDSVRCDGHGQCNWTMILSLLTNSAYELISFLLLILLGSRQFCPVYLCSFFFCFALANCAPSACWCLTVNSSGLACSICAPPCYTAVSDLCSSVSVTSRFPVRSHYLVWTSEGGLRGS
jgi:hypothetical protein